MAQNDDFLVISPFASRFPFETWILPKFHSPQFEDIRAGRTLTFALIIKDTLARLAAALSNPPFNFVIHSAPVENSFKNEYHWHVELMPKLTRVAGFEWGTGFYINPTAPEDAAAFLKELNIEN